MDEKRRPAPLMNLSAFLPNKAERSPLFKEWCEVWSEYLLFCRTNDFSKEHERASAASILAEARSDLRATHTAAERRLYDVLANFILMREEDEDGDRMARSLSLFEQMSGRSLRVLLPAEFEQYLSHSSDAMAIVWVYLTLFPLLFFRARFFASLDTFGLLYAPGTAQPLPEAFVIDGDVTSPVELSDSDADAQRKRQKRPGARLGVVAECLPGEARVRVRISEHEHFTTTPHLMSAQLAKQHVPSFKGTMRMTAALRALNLVLARRGGDPIPQDAGSGEFCGFFRLVMTFVGFSEEQIGTLLEKHPLFERVRDSDVARTKLHLPRTEMVRQWNERHIAIVPCARPLYMAALDTGGLGLAESFHAAQEASRGLVGTMRAFASFLRAKHSDGYWRELTQWVVPHCRSDDVVQRSCDMLKICHTIYTLCMRLDRRAGALLVCREWIDAYWRGVRAVRYDAPLLISERFSDMDSFVRRATSTEIIANGVGFTLEHFLKSLRWIELTAQWGAQFRERPQMLFWFFFKISYVRHMNGSNFANPLARRTLLAHLILAAISTAQFYLLYSKTRAHIAGRHELVETLLADSKHTETVSTLKLLWLLDSGVSQGGVEMPWGSSDTDNSDARVSASVEHLFEAVERALRDDEARNTRERVEVLLAAERIAKICAFYRETITPDRVQPFSNALGYFFGFLNQQLTGIEWWHSWGERDECAIIDAFSRLRVIRRAPESDGSQGQARWRDVRPRDSALFAWTNYKWDAPTRFMVPMEGRIAAQAAPSRQRLVLDAVMEHFDVLCEPLSDASAAWTILNRRKDSAADPNSTRARRYADAHIFGAFVSSEEGAGHHETLNSYVRCVKSLRIKSLASLTEEDPLRAWDMRFVTFLDPSLDRARRYVCAAHPDGAPVSLLNLFAAQCGMDEIEARQWITAARGHARGAAAFAQLVEEVGREKGLLTHDTMLARSEWIGRSVAEVLEQPAPAYGSPEHRTLVALHLLRWLVFE